MSNPNLILDIITCVISGLFFIGNWRIITSHFSNVIYVLFLIFYVFPIFVDCFYEIPPYGNHYDGGFGIPSLDKNTRIIYDIFIIYVQFIVVSHLRRHPNNGILGNTNTKRLYVPDWMLFVGMILPTIITLLVLQSPYMLYTFQWRELGLIEIQKFYWYVETLSYIAITCCALLLCSLGYKKSTRILAFIFLFMNICQQGKRAALFFALINVALVLYYNYVHIKRGKTTILSFFAIVSFVVVILQSMLSITFQVQQNRGFDDEVSNMVEMTRVDFLRDDRVRYSVYDELYNNGSILDFKGQSLIAEACNAFPLMYVLGRYEVARYKYQNMLSCSMVGEDPHISDKQHMTPCFIGELVSNFGIIIGLLITPFFIIWFIKKSRKYPYPLNMFVILCFALLNLFSVTYIVLFFEFTYLFTYIYNRQISKSV